MPQRRFLPTLPQTRHLVAKMRGDLSPASDRTETACRCAGWTTRDGHLTAEGLRIAREAYSKMCDERGVLMDVTV